jgi:hypothetical protein
MKKDLVKEVANKLGMTPADVWDVMLLKFRLEGFGDTVGMLCLFSSVVVSIMYLVHVMKRRDKYCNSDAGMPIYFMLPLIVVPYTVGVACVIYTNLVVALTKLLSPEYWAFQEILRMLK